MNRLVLSAVLLTATVFAHAQHYTLNGVEYTTETIPVAVSNFNGQTRSAAPKGKSKTVTLIRTSFSTPLDDYNALARPELKVGNIIGHPTLGWDDTDYHIPDIVPEIYDGEWVLRRRLSRSNLWKGTENGTSTLGKIRKGHFTTRQRPTPDHARRPLERGEESV